MHSRLLATGMAVVSIAAGLSVIEASPAAAATRYGCVYPRVCMYLHASDWAARKPTATYKRMTASVQVLGPRSRHAYAVFNSRNDDVAWVVDAEGSRGCIEPNEVWFADGALPPNRITGVRIEDFSNCAQDPAVP